MTFHPILKVHIVCAVLTAILFWPPLFLTKGGRLHVAIGKAYAAVLFLMTLTAMAVSALAWAGEGDAPLADRAYTGTLLDRFRSDPPLFRLYVLLLVYIAVGTLAALVGGLRALRNRGLPQVGPMGFFAMIALLGAGIAFEGGRHRELPVVAIGLAGTVFGGWLTRVFARARARDAILDHFSAMICSGIGTYSAIAVVVANRAMPEFFGSRAGIVVWVLPAAIGAVAIAFMRRAFRHAPPIARR